MEKKIIGHSCKQSGTVCYCVFFKKPIVSISIIWELLVVIPFILILFRLISIMFLRFIYVWIKQLLQLCVVL